VTSLTAEARMVSSVWVIVPPKITTGLVAAMRLSRTTSPQIEAPARERTRRSLE